MTPERGRMLAQEHGLDLVEVAPNARPPVCRLMDYGRFRYDQSKKQQAQKKQVVQLKTIQLRPKTDTHDLETKLKRAERFLEQGHRVRVLMRLRGRERGLVPRWLGQMQELIDHFGDKVKVIAPPVAEGRGVAMTLEPV